MTDRLDELRAAGKPNRRSSEVGLVFSGQQGAELLNIAEALRDALVALRTMMERGPIPHKLDDALSWRDNDELAEAMGDAAIAKLKQKQI